ncbi:MAG: thiamine pyrophosphate-dependent enzyme [Nanoarchaeota archaeon]|nr:thiamine pyrophosphate-dependent enzyme [Nanoarchaeota archaeon]
MPAKEKKEPVIGTSYEITWCPGCANFMILASVKNAIGKLIKEGFCKQEDFAITTDIGCNSKIFDYINLSGFYGLHGRSLPTGVGIKFGNPNLHVLSFVGDGGLYNEGIEHLIHTCRYNSDMTLIVHDNQSFSLTAGQPTATTQQGYKSKVEPYGEVNRPLNPLKLVLASGATFVARCDARDINHTSEIIEKAIKHKGFAFVEIIQDCLIFNTEMNFRNKLAYKIPDNKDKKKAESYSDEWNYNSKQGKIPIGVIYQELIPTLEENWKPLKELIEKKSYWKYIK